jgi:hypothetical protein
MEENTPMYIDQYLRELEKRLRMGEVFVEIEDWVEELDATEEVKAALWLLAWADQERFVQRRVASEALVQLARARA